MVLKDSSLATVIGEEVEKLGSSTIYVITMEGEDRRLAATMLSGLRKVEMIEKEKINIAVRRDTLGTLTKKVAGSWGSKRDGKIPLFMNEDEGQKGKKPKESRRIVTVVMKKKGATYAQLLKEVKESVGQDLFGEMLSVRKGRLEEVKVRIKEEKVSRKT